MKRHAEQGALFAVPEGQPMPITVESVAAGGHGSGADSLPLIHKQEAGRQTDRRARELL